MDMTNRRNGVRTGSNPKTPRDVAAAYADRWNLGFTVRDLHRLFRLKIRERLASENALLSYWSYLWALYEQDGLAQHELAKRVRLVGPSIVAAINQMERKGLVRRVRSESDRRVVHIFLTAKGRGLRTTIRSIAMELNERALGDLTDDEIDTLLALLARARAGLERPVG